MGDLPQTFELAYGGERTLPIPFEASAGEDEIDGFGIVVPGRTTRVVVVRRVLANPNLSWEEGCFPVSSMRCDSQGVAQQRSMYFLAVPTACLDRQIISRESMEAD